MYEHGISAEDCGALFRPPLPQTAHYPAQPLPRHLWGEFHALDKIFAERSLLVAVQTFLEPVENVLISVAKEPSCACCRIAYAIIWCRLHHFTHGLNHWARREVLARTARRFLS